MSSRDPVLVLFNEPRSDAGYTESDAGVLAEVRAVLAALQAMGLQGRSRGIRRLDDLPPLLAAAPEQRVFNLVEELPGGPEEANLVPAVCAAAGKACTGGSTPCLCLALDKGRAKAVLAGSGVAVPAGVVVRPGEGVPPLVGPGPWIVKPAQADASEGIHAATAVHRGPGEALEQAVAALHRQLGQAVVVESFCDGRELNVALLEEGGHPRVLAVAEIEFVDFPPGTPRVVDYAAKWQPGSFAYEHTRRVVPAVLDPELRAQVERLALASWRALGCRGYARVDLRTDAEGRPFVIEVNPNPDIAPDSGFQAALGAAGLELRHLVQRALEAALVPDGDRELLRLQTTHALDRDPILALLEATGFFPPHELEVAREVLDDAIAGAHDGHYRSLTALRDGRPVGWACVGPCPCTRGSWDLYWLAVHPDEQGRGLGRRLLARAEALALGLGARLLLAETAGRDVYAPTRSFYRACGYREEARVADFYDRGDDKVIFARRLR
jgi:D-alanine-D-alanine ligase